MNDVWIGPSSATELAGILYLLWTRGSRTRRAFQSSSSLANYGLMAHAIFGPLWSVIAIYLITSYTSILEVNFTSWYPTLVLSERLILKKKLFNNLHCVIWIGNSMSNSSSIVEYFIIISTLFHIFVKSN